MLLALKPTPGNFFLVLAPAMLLVFLFVLWLIRRRHSPGPAALTTEGEVVDFEEGRIGAGTAGGMVTRLRVRFRTLAGQTVTGTTATGNSLARLQYRRGQRVPVHYDAADPQRFSVGRFDQTNYTLLIVVFGLICLALLVLGGFYYLA
ncbi:DUF3592 domain-containing protein [Hymenobacter gummosus]|nr:DUF3592 domain-containing protein [Hymenobacter gummosus]